MSASSGLTRSQATGLPMQETTKATDILYFYSALDSFPCLSEHLLRPAGAGVVRRRSSAPALHDSAFLEVQGSPPISARQSACRPGRDLAISNHRLRALENGCVSFEWKDYAHQGQRKIMTLDAVEFMRRFLLHVLPSGLVRIRHFGFLANRFRTRNLRLCRDLLAVCQTLAPADSHNPADTNVPDHSSCPICKLGRLIMIQIIHPQWAMVPDTS
jgi:Putative transposase